MRIIKLKFWFLIRFLCNFVAARQSHQSHVKKEKKSNKYKTKNDNKKQLLLVQHNDLYEKKKKTFQKEHTNTINKFINLSCAHSMKQKLFVYLFLLFIK